MCFTKHLTIRIICCVALTPCCHMVGIHLIQSINPLCIIVMSNSTIGTIRLIVRIGIFRLLVILPGFSDFLSRWG